MADPLIQAVYPTEDELFGNFNNDDDEDLDDDEDDDDEDEDMVLENHLANATKAIRVVRGLDTMQ